MVDEVPQIIMYAGPYETKNIEDMSRYELLQAVKQLGQQLQNSYAAHRSLSEVRAMQDEVRAKRYTTSRW